MSAGWHLGTFAGSRNLRCTPTAACENVRPSTRARGGLSEVEGLRAAARRALAWLDERWRVSRELDERWRALGHFRWRSELTVYKQARLRKRPSCRRALAPRVTR